MDIGAPSLESKFCPIFIGSGIINQLPDLIASELKTSSFKIMIVTDENISRLHLNLLQTILSNAGFVIGISIISSGESSKNLINLEYLIDRCVEFKLDRSDIIVAFGGGVVGDMAGFLAATYMRGVNYIQVPTTSLAHDSSIGGKVGVNHLNCKNLVGSYHHPVLVAYDVDFLSTLPKREIISGYAELIKHGFISGSSFWDYLDEHANEILTLDSPYIEEALHKGMQVKIEIVTRDERDSSVRYFLNFGHTIGHALEIVTNFSVFTHGEAISIGMVGALHLSSLVFDTSDDLINDMISLLKKYHLPTQCYKACSVEALLDAIGADKKAKDGEYTFVLAKDFGKMQLVRDIPEELVIKSLKKILS